jgi:protein-S-isoprenylcysteine O-methyltransferase Ste14
LGAVQGGATRALAARVRRGHLSRSAQFGPPLPRRVTPAANASSVISDAASDSRAPSERTPAARAGAVLFRHRGWLPVPLLIGPLLLPGEQRPATWLGGAVLVALGEAVRVAGVAAAGTVTRRRSREVQRLVTYGIFAWTRNPLYVGNFLAWLGVTVASGVLWFLPITMLLFAIEYSLIVRFEEGVLESTFGDEYLAYKRRTPRWLARPPREREQGPHDWADAWRGERSTLVHYLALTLALVLKQMLR